MLDGGEKREDEGERREKEWRLKDGRAEESEKIGVKRGKQRDLKVQM